MRDTYICNDVSTLDKVGQTNWCLIDLFMNDLGRAKLSCKYQVLPSKDFAVRINNEQIYVYFTNKTVLTKKCIGDATVTKLVAHGPNIINVAPGCRIQSTNYIFKRNKNIVSEEMKPVLIQTPSDELWTILTENSEDEQIKDVLDEMMKQQETGVNMVDIEQKFGLRTLHKKSKITRAFTWTSTGVLMILTMVMIGYLWKKCTNHRKKEPGVCLPPRMKLRFTDLLEEHDESEQHNLQEPQIVSSKGPAKLKNKGPK